MPAKKAAKRTAAAGAGGGGVPAAAAGAGSAAGGSMGGAFEGSGAGSGGGGARAAAAAGSSRGGAYSNSDDDALRGNVEARVRIVGLPLSTFTRTLVMACHLKQLPVQQVAVPPHSAEAKAHHPYGRIPSVGFWFEAMTRQLAPTPQQRYLRDGEWPAREPEFWLFESQSVARYLDSQFSGFDRPCLHDPANGGRDVVIAQWVSCCADYVFNSVEHGVVKPRLARIAATTQQLGGDAAAAMAACVAELGTAADPLAAGVAKVKECLAPFEQLAAATTPAAPFLMGSTLTWVDLFLVPILADLHATVDAPHLLSAAAGAHPHLHRWLTQTMFAVPAFQRTYPGSLADQLKVAQLPPAGVAAGAAGVGAGAGAAGAAAAAPVVPQAIPAGAKAAGAKPAHL